MLGNMPAPFPLRPAAARLRHAHPPKSSAWPTTPAPATVPVGKHPDACIVRTAREYWGFTQEEAAAKVFAAQRTWQKWEARNSTAMPLAAWALFNRVASERDATHFQFVIAHGAPLVVKIGSFVMLQPRRGPRLIAQLLADDGASCDDLTPGTPQGRAHGVVVGFPDLDDAELIGCPYRRGEPVRFSLHNIMTVMHQLPDAHRYAVSVDDPAVLEALDATVERLLRVGVPSKVDIVRDGRSVSAVLTATSTA
ncbi:Uncharacterised protein [Achromobacter sp. 2789STDY5608615]|nr:Uncharacterised protein [Achromobacter sp. 2789STDY5608615]